MRLYYLTLSLLLLRKIQKRLMAIVIHHGRDVRISKTFMAGELYYKMSGTYAKGIKTIETATEMKEHHDTLRDLLSDLDRILSAIKKPPKAT